MWTGPARWLLAAGVVFLAWGCGGSPDYGGSTPTTPAAPQAGRVQGTVVDSAGGGVSGAALSLSANGQTTLRTSTGANGGYAFTQVPPGGWTLTLAAPAGFTVAQSAIPVSVAAAQTASVDFTVARLATNNPPPVSGNASVTIRNFAFSPDTVVVAVGSTVTWTNDDAVTHTVTADGGAFDTGDIGSNGSAHATLDSAGTYAYHCSIHTGMKGTIVVR